MPEHSVLKFETRRHAPRTFSLHRAFLRISLVGVNAYAWVLLVLYFGGSLEIVAGLYFFSSILTFFLTPLTARLVSKGLIECIMAATALYALGCGALAICLSGDFGFGPLGAFLFIILSGLYRALYWVPYRAREEEKHILIGAPFAVDLITALTPLFLGYFIALHGGVWFLWFSGALATFSIFALAGATESYEKFSWDYKQTFDALFATRHRRHLLAAILEGVQAAGLFFLWPLAIYLLVGGNFVVFGTVISITLLLTMALKLIMRYVREGHGIKLSPWMFSAVGASSWLMRLGVITPLQIISVDVFQNMGHVGRNASMDVITFEQAADNGHFLDEFSALKEMGLALGRIFMALIVVALASFVSTTEALGYGIALAAALAALLPYFSTQVR